MFHAIHPGLMYEVQAVSLKLELTGETACFLFCGSRTLAKTGIRLNLSRHVDPGDSRVQSGSSVQALRNPHQRRREAAGAPPGFYYGVTQGELDHRHGRT